MSIFFDGQFFNIFHYLKNYLALRLMLVFGRQLFQQFQLFEPVPTVHCHSLGFQDSSG